MAGNSAAATGKIPKYAAGTQPFTVLIEGNIGSGKTTFLNHFQQFQEKICLITEPVEKWRNVRGVNLLVSIMQIIPLNIVYIFVLQYFPIFRNLCTKNPNVGPCLSNRMSR